MGRAGVIPDIISSTLIHQLANTNFTAQMANVVGESGKILLKIQLLNSESISFQFQKIKDRDEIISIIKANMGNQRSVSEVIKNDSNLRDASVQARMELLEANPEWRKIHKELVIGKIISEDEFWSVRKVFLD
jgi:K+/H+ antiporter YhaU regulatory subunit KhtT